MPVMALTTTSKKILILALPSFMLTKAFLLAVMYTISNIMGTSNKRGTMVPTFVKICLKYLWMRMFRCNMLILAERRLNFFMLLFLYRLSSGLLIFVEQLQVYLRQ